MHAPHPSSQCNPLLSPSRNLILQIIRPPIMTRFLLPPPTPRTPSALFTPPFTLSAVIHRGLLASRLASPENLILQFIRKSVVGGGVVFMHVSFAATASVE